jgi:hypothetical protein
MRRSGTLIGLAAMCVTMAFATGTAGAAVSVSNPAAITISSPPGIGLSQPANPYPSTISVRGLSGLISDLNVRLTGFSHGKPNDADVLLKGPGGQTLMLLGGPTDETTAQPASGLNLTIDDQAASLAPNASPLASGSYKPTGYYIDTFPAPGPGTTYGNPGPINGGTATLASTFNGLSPNGVWSLFVIDVQTGANNGAIAGGWSLDFTGPTAPAKKCKKKKKGGSKDASAAKKKKCKKKKKKKAATG